VGGAVVAGGSPRLGAYRLADGKPLWSTPVTADAKWVSTGESLWVAERQAERGRLACFSPRGRRTADIALTGVPLSLAAASGAVFAVLRTPHGELQLSAWRTGA
jgi:hypothetical protein